MNSMSYEEYQTRHACFLILDSPVKCANYSVDILFERVGRLVEAIGGICGSFACLNMILSSAHRAFWTVVVLFWLFAWHCCTIMFVEEVVSTGRIARLVVR